MSDAAGTGTPLRAVFCYICFGDLAARLTRLSVASLRLQGWAGDVVVLTDHPRSWSDTRLREVVVPRGVVNTDPHSPFTGAEIDCRAFRGDEGPRQAVQNLAPIMHRWLNLPELDLVVMLDSDVLATGSVQSCLERLSARLYAFGVGRNERRLKSSRASNLHLSWWEMQRWRQAPCINSGFLYFRPDRLAMEILRAWEFETRRFIAGDQAALQAVFLRQFRDRVDVTGFEFQDFAPMPRHYSGDPEDLVQSGSFFLHFRGAIANPAPLRDYIARFLPALAQSVDWTELGAVREPT